MWQSYVDQEGTPEKKDIPAFTSEKVDEDTNISSEPINPDRQKSILGLRVTTVWLLVALIVAIFAAIIGGGLAAKAHCDNIDTKTCSSASPAAQPSATSTGSSTSIVTSILPPQTSLASGCSASSGWDWSSTTTKLRYKRVCNAFMNPELQDYTVRFTSYQQYFYTCISSCDSYNFWSQTQDVNVASWNWGGTVNKTTGADETPGICFCTYAKGNYIVPRTTGHDSALLRGTFNDDDLPS